VPVGQGRYRGGLEWGTIVARIAMYTLVPQVFSLTSSMITLNGVTSLGSLASTFTWISSLYSLLNVLWAVWDPKRQCWHDKVARTQVVRP